MAAAVDHVPARSWRGSAAGSRPGGPPARSRIPPGASSGGASGMPTIERRAGPAAGRPGPGRDRRGLRPRSEGDGAGLLVEPADLFGVFVDQQLFGGHREEAAHVAAAAAGEIGRRARRSSPARARPAASRRIAEGFDADHPGDCLPAWRAPPRAPPGRPANGRPGWRRWPRPRRAPPRGPPASLASEARGRGARVAPWPPRSTVTTV